MMNKKGNILTMIFFIGILFIILILGFLMIVGSAILNWTMDEAVPELSNLGVIGNTNMTEVADYTLTPLNNIVQSFTWLAGVLYVLMLVGSFGILFVFRETSSKWLIGFYIALMLVLIMGSILMSNIYEDFIGGDDDLGSRLKEHTILSFMILESPKVFTVIGFIFGILLFSGIQEEDAF